MGVFFIIWNFLKCYVLGFIELVSQKRQKHKEFTGSLLQNQEGRVAIVTGGSRGIGFETVKGLLRHGIQVIIGSKDSEEAYNAIEEIKKDYPTAKVEYHHLDLGSFDSIQNFAQWFKSAGFPLHILINNAGVMLTPHRVTQNGFEEQFGVNYLGHFLLTQILLPILERSSTEVRRSRIVNVSSVTHCYGIINWTDLAGSQCYSSHAAYAQSKLAIILSSYALHRHLQAEGSTVTVNCLHPGIVDTYLYQNVNWFAKLVQKCFININLLLTSKEGADTSLYVALSPDLEGVGGQYFDNSTAKKSSTSSYNKEMQEKLWNLSCQLTGLEVS